MNAQSHRIIFSKSRGCLMVVGESARNSGAGSGAVVRRVLRRCNAITSQERSGTQSPLTQAFVDRFGIVKSAGELNLLAEKHEAHVVRQDGSTKDEVKYETSRITAGGNLTLQSAGDLTVQGGKLSAGQELTMLSLGQLQIDSPQSYTRTQIGSDIRQSEQTERVQIQAGGNVTLYGQQAVQLDATDVNAAGKALVQSQGDIELGYNTDTDQHNWTTSTKKSYGGLKKKTTTTQHETVDKSAEVTKINADQVQVLGNNITSLGADITGRDLVQVEGVGKTALYAVSDEHLSKADSKTSSSFIGITYSKTTSSDSQLNSTALGTTLTSEEAIKVGVGTVTDVRGAIMTAPKIDIVRSEGADTSKSGELILGTSSNTTTTSHTETKTSSLGLGAVDLWQAQSGQGSTTETANNTVINGQLNIGSGINTTVQIPEGKLKDQIAALGQQPGLEYLKDLANDPKIKWEQVKLAHDQWSYSQQGLTGAGAALLSIAIAVYTGGMGAELLGTSTSAAGAAGAVGASTTALAGTTLATTTAATATAASVTTYTAAGAALNAGFSALVSTAGISFVNNGGDIGQTLKDLGSKDNVKNLLIAMGTGGVGASVAGQGFTAVAAQTLTGCVAGEVSGAGCETGAKTAAVLSGAGEAYRAWVGYAANAGPGENRNGTKLDGTSTGNASYEPVRFGPNFGQQQPIDRGMNVIGFNEPGSWGSQGGVLSRALNQVPTINATAGLHDYIFNANWLDQTTFNNVWTMPASALVAIPAALNNSNIFWLTQVKKPDSIKAPVVQSVIRINASSLRTNELAGGQK